jgi:hypothetical protein
MASVTVEAHPVELGERRMRQLGAQVDQGDEYPIGEHELVLAPCPGLPSTVPTTAVTQRGLTSRLPRTGQLLDQIAEMCMGDTGEGRMDKAARAHFLVTLEEPVRPPARHGV